MNCPPGEVAALLLGMALALAWRTTFPARENPRGDYLIALAFVVIAFLMPGVWK